MCEADRPQDNNRSSLFEKIPPDLRRALDVAIAEHVPPTFRAVWMQFELGKFGVSFTAFYRYARRLRERVNLLEAAALAGEDDADVDAAIQKLLSRRLLELLLHTGGAECTQEIAALTSAQRRGAKTAVDHRRLELDRDHLRLKSEALQISRRALENRPAETKTLRLANLNDDADANAPAAAAHPDPEKCGTGS